MKIKDLKSNPKNPRKMNQKAKDSLRKSLEKYGDLSGFVYNRRSKMLISGHQKKSLTPESTIKIEHKYDVPTKAMTVADGYVIVDGEKFKYREVDADPVWEAEAMIAANKHSGEWDQDLLKVLAIDLPEIDLELAGFELDEIKALDLPEAPKSEVSVSNDYEEREETDEEYVANTVESTEQIPTERIDIANVGEKKMDVVGKRFVIIIDCSSAEHKEALKEKIKPLVTEAGGKFF